jgi:hypothetical protein
VNCFLKKWKPQQSPPVLSFFVNVKPILFSLPYVVSIAKQAAQLRAAVFGAGGVPKAFLNRDIKAAPTAVLCTFPP